MRAFMRTRCGVLLAEEQHYLLDARLGPLARDFSFPTVEAFVASACAPSSDEKLRRAVVAAMTTHETMFFRDQPFWKLLEARIVPALRATGRRSLRVWSAACSTGQEPYSLAILLAQLWPEGAAGTQIIATDVSEIALERAKEGLFSQLEVKRGLDPATLARSFEVRPAGWRIKESLRKRIEWRVDNLLSPKPGPKECDLVLCRNVLIYFDENDRQQVQRRLRASVAPAGYLGFGGAEISTQGESLGAGWYRAR